MNSTQGGGNKKSSMIENEKKAIERIMERQRKEVEQMLDYEIEMEKFRAKNEENMMK